MKKLQNNFTTPEQSRRLMELGVPADSADQVYYDDIMWGAHEFLHGRYSEVVAGYENISLPCWSLGRLMEIMSICGDDIGQRKLDITRVSKYYNDSVNVIELAVEDIEKLITDDGIDFSKLEE